MVQPRRMPISNWAGMTIYPEDIKTPSIITKPN
jgi:hypothetical protein